MMFQVQTDAKISTQKYQRAHLPIYYFGINVGIYLDQQ